MRFISRYPDVQPQGRPHPMTEPESYRQYVGTVHFPRTTADLTSTTQCPACFTPLQSAICATCGLDLNHPAAAELATLSAGIAADLDRRLELIGRMRYETAQLAAQVVAPIAPTAAPVPRAVRRAPASPQRRPCRSPARPSRHRRRKRPRLRAATSACRSSCSSSVSPCSRSVRSRSSCTRSSTSASACAARSRRA